MDRTAGKEGGYHAIPIVRYGDKVAALSYCDALHRVHRPVRKRSQRSMPARRPAEPLDAQENSLSLRRQFQSNPPSLFR